MCKNCIEEKEILATLVDADGVVIDYIYAGDKVVHKDEEKPTDKYYFDFNRDKKFVKLYSGMSSLKRNLKLNDAQFAVMIELSDYVSYEDCILREGGHGNGKILTIGDLADKLEMKYDTLQKIMSVLVRKGILGIHKTGSIDNPNILTKAITVNPYVYTRGTKVNKTILGLFEKTGLQDILK